MLTLRSGIDTHINRVSEKKHIPKLCFDLWKLDVLTAVEKKLNSIKTKKFRKPYLRPNSKAPNYLETSQNKFVIVPTDKAENNVSIICKKYYHECMTKELQSEVYQTVNEEESCIIEIHKKVIKKWNIDVPEEHTKVPFIYNTAKQHKNPIGNRFIVSVKMFIVLFSAYC